MDETAVAIWSLIVTVVLAGIGGWYSAFQLRRSNLQQIAELHRDLTTGEVAEARHVIGTWFYSPSRRGDIDDDLLTKSYYRLCWAVERVNNSLIAHRSVLLFEEGPNRKPRRRGLRLWVFGDASEGLGWSLDEILRNIGRLHLQERERLNLNDRNVQEWLQKRLGSSLRERYTLALQEVGPAEKVS